MFGVMAAVILCLVIAVILLQQENAERGIDILEWDENEQDAQDLMDILLLDEEEELL